MHLMEEKFAQYMVKNSLPAVMGFGDYSLFTKRDMVNILAVVGNIANLYELDITDELDKILIEWREEHANDPVFIIFQPQDNTPVNRLESYKGIEIHYFNSIPGFCAVVPMTHGEYLALCNLSDTIEKYKSATDALMATHICESLFGG